jgi:hypothetical protein
MMWPEDSPFFQRTISMPQQRKVGITHFPLPSEQHRQDKVRAGKAKAGKTNARTSGSSGKNGHRISREQGAQSSAEAERSFTGSGGKGGKSRGSRAGLLASSRKVRNKSVRMKSR